MPREATITRSEPDLGSVSLRRGRYELRFVRHLDHPPERVWAAITDPGELVAWWGAATVELAAGGRFDVRWLNTGDETVELHGTIVELDPPRLLALDTDLHGPIRFELAEEHGGTRLVFTTSPEAKGPMVPITQAGWHVHLDFLAEALDGRAVDWPRWPRGRWDAVHQRYVAAFD